MSEFQYIEFRAIDGPVSKKNLEYMDRQSSRAEISPWQFCAEYNYSDFRGNVLEMLRRGYDLHLHYANFGVRKLLIRLPQGLPDPGAAKPYFSKDAVEFVKDSNGAGGVLKVEPFHESGDLDELWDLDDWVEKLVPVRAEILEGDLRPFYLAHLAISCDGNHDPETTREGPVPAGLDSLTEAQQALAEFYGISPALIQAAAKGGPPRTSRGDVRTLQSQWLRNQSQTMKDGWLSELLADPAAPVRAQMLAAFRSDHRVAAWPTARLDRTIEDLQAAGEEIRLQSERKAADLAEKKRKQKLVKIAADPTSILRETEELAATRTTDAYVQVGDLLADLRKALADTDQSGLADEQALKLTKLHPTLSRLKSELRKKGFLPKSK